MTHRVIGTLEVLDDNEKPVQIKVTRIIVKKSETLYYVAEVMNFDGDISSPEDQEAIEETGTGFSDPKHAVDMFNIDDFDADKYLFENSEEEENLEDTVDD